MYILSSNRENTKFIFRRNGTRHGERSRVRA
nr:MAG TPA: hypothetical protein [Inoviridae sp.]